MWESPGRDLIVFDQRGTGAGALRCRDLEAATDTDAGREAAACATLLGDRRRFFRTRDTVEDVEALRAELGVDRLTIVGTAYGADVAQRYALRYPDRVERLLLESPVDAAGVDPLYVDSMAAVRRMLSALCRSGAAQRQDRGPDRTPAHSIPHAPPDPGPMPDVLVLVLAAPETVRSSLESARRTAARFPDGKLLETPGLLRFLGFGLDACANRAALRFLSGRRVRDRCPRAATLLPPASPAPVSLSDLAPVGGVSGRPGRLLHALSVTLGDLVDSFYADALLNIGVRLRESDDLTFAVRGRLAGRRVRTRVRIRSRLGELFSQVEEGGGAARLAPGAPNVLGDAPGSCRLPPLRNGTGPCALR